MSILINQATANYTKLPNELIEDTDISAGAFRVMAYLFSRPDGWRINNKDIQKRLGIARRETIAKYWKELVDSGWLERTKKQGENGYDFIINHVRKISTGFVLKKRTHNKTKTTSTKVEGKPPKKSEEKKAHHIHTGYLIEPPVENLNFEAWKAWIDYRKQRRLPKYTTDNKAKALAKIPHDKQMECVNHSIDNCYAGIFPDKFTGNQGYQKQILDLASTNY